MRKPWTVPAPLWYDVHSRITCRHPWPGVLGGVLLGVCPLQGDAAERLRERDPPRARRDRDHLDVGGRRLNLLLKKCPSSSERLRAPAHRRPVAIDIERRGSSARQGEPPARGRGIASAPPCMPTPLSVEAAWRGQGRSMSHGVRSEPQRVRNAIDGPGCPGHSRRVAKVGAQKQDAQSSPGGCVLRSFTHTNGAAFGDAPAEEAPAP